MSLSELARKRPRLSPPSLSLRNQELALSPSLPMTPPDPDGAEPIPGLNSGVSAVDTALHVFSMDMAAMANLQGIYATDKLARSSMERAVMQTARSVRVGGKLVLSGVGKSGLIAKKIVATMNSMGVQSAFLHPTEALHGDLGMVRENDTILFITFSGKTSELMLLLPHLPSTVTIIAITAHRNIATCPLLSNTGSRTTILLPAPVHEPEEVSFGLPAPMTSTTVALAIGDALALATAQKIHTQPGRGPPEIFRAFHPGGAIGASFASDLPLMENSDSGTSSSSSVDLNHRPVKQQENGTCGLKKAGEITLFDLAKPLSEIHQLCYSNNLDETPYSLVRNILCESVINRESEQWLLCKDSSVTRIISPRRQHYLASQLDHLQDADKVDAREYFIDLQATIPLPQSITVTAARQILKNDPRAPEWVKKGDTHPEHPFRLDENRTIVPAKGRIIGIINEREELVGVLEEEDIWIYRHRKANEQEVSRCKDKHSKGERPGQRPCT